MNLHRTTGSPDWIAVPEEKRGSWQRLAAATNGMVTPGNFLTIVGLALVLQGLAVITAHHYWQGLVLVIIGRLCDLADGWAAEITSTKSPLGELLDVTADKFVVFMSIIMFYISAVAPRWLLIALLLPHVGITILTLIKLTYRRHIHPSRPGKISMAMIWLSLLGFVLARALEASNTSFIGVLALALGALSFALGTFAFFGYLTEKS